MAINVGRQSRLVYDLSWLALFIVLAAALQAAVPFPVDSDTVYHFVVGRLIAQHGLLHAFPWTEFSWLADHYADKELLFHLLFVPLQSFDLVTASRIVGTGSTAALLFALYLVLDREGVRQAGLWAILPLVASSIFLVRMAVVRPYVLAIALVLIMLHSAARQRLPALALAALAFPWIYVAFWQLPLIVLTCTAMAQLLTGKQLRWQPAAVVLAGILTGVAIHPNAAHLFGVSWVNMTEMLVNNTWGGHDKLIMGAELLPFSLRQWSVWLMVVSVLGAVGCVIAWRQRRQGDEILTSFALATAGFALLTVTSGKFAEYFVPLAVATMALASRRISYPRLLPMVFALSLAYTLLCSRQTLATLTSQQDDLPQALVKTMRDTIPPGAHIFSHEWDRTGRFMLDLPDRYFMVALDPTFFSVRHPALYDLWRQLETQTPIDAAAIIRSRFGADFLINRYEPKYYPLLYRLESSPGVRILYADNDWVLVDLGR
ncbi:hypothetical protein KI809_07350 [Geobacter pelophilus]|uniref:Dolichyl-phosphate-mannose-protein mannosyltransferase n=1 Tax=Geoanaerobacter pelophilus TaxID=60036 RepID=A0AAW4L764_9BACT|nr:hypothetical protein [Geoanaerobacter pelophilus]MBT0664116.1 hypothetical protein [Geoanaerobacter pelophilus]